MYAKLEENHGLARHAMAIYERSTKAVLPEEQFEVSTHECLVVLIYCFVFHFSSNFYNMIKQKFSIFIQLIRSRTPIPEE